LWHCGKNDGAISGDHGIYCWDHEWKTNVQTLSLFLITF
jgi:hypothetical protein